MSETNAPSPSDSSLFGPAGNAEQYMQLLIRNAVKMGVSDIHIKTGSAPYFRLSGSIKAIDSLPPLSAEAMVGLLETLTDETQRTEFATTNQIDLAKGFDDFGRVRVNLFRQRGSVSMVLRLIPSDMPDPKALAMPDALDKFAQLKRGMVLVTGPTGSGKSTTLAALIDLINRSFAKHIVTIEDPIEFVFADKRSIINQREVGIDTPSFTDAMRSALRQDPDVILIGELRDAITINTAVKASDTGHLVLSTLHASGAMETLTRLLSNFPPEEQQTVRIALAQNLKGVISQRLVPRADGKGRAGGKGRTVQGRRLPPGPGDADVLLQRQQRVPGRLLAARSRPDRPDTPHPVHRGAGRPRPHLPARYRA